MKQTVYIASPESQQIHVWNLNHEGALTLTQVVDVPGRCSRWWSARTNVISMLVCALSFASWRIVSPGRWRADLCCRVCATG